MLRRQMPFCKDAALVAVADVYTEMISNASNLKVANQVAAQACGLIPDVLDPREQCFGTEAFRRKKLFDFLGSR